MIGIINYRVGNIFNLQNALHRLGIPSKIIDSPDALEGGESIILPGVGSFKYAMDNLERFGFADMLRQTAETGRILGICVGMQLLYSEGREEVTHKGLGIIDGVVRKLNVPLKIPHMGWNQLDISASDRLFDEVSDKSWVYFVHSYACVADDPEVTIATADYGGAFTAAVKKKGVYGLQFHPEKSHTTGLQMLKNFCLEG